MSERVAIAASTTWPTPDDISHAISALPAGTVVVTDDRQVPGRIVHAAANRAGIDVVFHELNRARDGDAASYRQAEAIVGDCDRLIAFAAKDSKTRQITEGTALRIRLAERRNIPVEVIETPVPARVCALIARLRHRYDGIAHAPTPGHRDYRIRSARDLLQQLILVETDFRQRLADGWDEIEATDDLAERARLDDLWCRVLLPTYQITHDVVAEALSVLGSFTEPTYPLHRHSLHRPTTTEPIPCVA